ncbi:hypothetical protein Efla_004165 [Eimeria flavescens]
MDLKGWAAAVAQRSTQLAREGMHYVEKKIEQQQQQLQQQASWGGALFRKSGSPWGEPPEEEGPLVAVPSAATYYIQASDCRGFPPADAIDYLQQQQRQQQQQQQQQQLQQWLPLHQLTSQSLASADRGPNCFLLPPGVPPELVTVGLFRSLFFAAQLAEGEGAPSFHLRFRAPCPGAPSGFVWVDAPPEDQPVPTCSSSSSSSSSRCIVCKALLLPPAVEPKTAAAAQASAAAAAAATPAAARDSAAQAEAAAEDSLDSSQQQQQRQEQQQQQEGEPALKHSVNSSWNEGPPSGREGSPSRAPPPDLVGGDFMDEAIGAGGPPGGPPRALLLRAQSDPNQHMHAEGLQRCHTAQEPLSRGEAVLPRAELAANREAKKQQRMLEKLQEVEKRRAHEIKQQQDKLALPVELKLELDRWAKTADGSFKDVRTLLSTMHEVLWPDAAWEPATLSSLMMPATLKSRFRRALLLAHPDKHQSAPPDRQYRAERIFQALNESFKAFTN